MKQRAVCLILCLVVFLTALPMPAAAAEEQVLYVYNWGEYISDGSDGSIDVIAEFEATHPGVRVDYQTYATNEEMYAKIVSGSAEYDVLIPSDYMVGKLIEEDRLAPLNFENIENYRYIDESFRGLEYDPENKYSVPYTWGTVGIIYNKTKVTEPVESWDILWDANYAGQILMFNNPRDAFGIALKKLGYSQNTTDPEQLAEATEVLKEQKWIVQAYVMDEIFPKMTNGEAALAPYYAGDAITMIEDNPDLAFAVPKEGTNPFVDAMVIPKTSKNKELAEEFINFMLNPEIAAANISYIGYSTPMTAARELLDDALKDSPISYPDESILEKCDTFVNLDEETNDYMQNAWIEVLAFGENDVGAIVCLIVETSAIIALAVFLIIKKRKNR